MIYYITFKWTLLIKIKNFIQNISNDSIFPFMWGFVLKSYFMFADVCSFSHMISFLLHFIY